MMTVTLWISPGQYEKTCRLVKLIATQPVSNEDLVEFEDACFYTMPRPRCLQIQINSEIFDRLLDSQISLI